MQCETCFHADIPFGFDRWNQPQGYPWRARELARAIIDGCELVIRTNRTRSVWWYECSRGGFLREFFRTTSQRKAERWIAAVLLLRAHRHLVPRRRKVA